MVTYKVKSLIGAIPASKCPPDIVAALWPSAAPIAVRLSAEGVEVDFPAPVAPAFADPLLSVELISQS